MKAAHVGRAQRHRASANPAAAYFERLHPSGRRSMLRALNCVVAIFTDERVIDATEFDWSEITQEQVQKLRSVMVARGSGVPMLSAHVM